MAVDLEVTSGRTFWVLLLGAMLGGVMIQIWRASVLPTIQKGL